MKQKIMNFLREEEGASAVEYGLLVTLIALAIIGGANALGKSINTMFNNAAGTVANPHPTTP